MSIITNCLKDFLPNNFWSLQLIWTIRAAFNCFSLPQIIFFISYWFDEIILLIKSMISKLYLIVPYGCPISLVKGSMKTVERRCSLIFNVQQTNKQNSQRSAKVYLAIIRGQQLLLHKNNYMSEPISARDYSRSKVLLMEERSVKGGQLVPLKTHIMAVLSSQHEYVWLIKAAPL